MPEYVAPRSFLLLAVFLASLATFGEIRHWSRGQDAFVGLLAVFAALNALLDYRNL